MYCWQIPNFYQLRAQIGATPQQRLIYCVAEAAGSGAAGTTRVVGGERSGAVTIVRCTELGGTGMYNGPFCPQPDSQGKAVKPASVTASPWRDAAIRKQPKIREEKTMMGL